MRKYIVFGQEHYNPLGVIRSLGESGIYPVAIILKDKKVITSKSKYISKLYFVKSYEEGYELLLKEYGKEKEKSFLYTCDDKTTAFLDRHFNELIDKFIFFNAGIQGRIVYYMDKANILELAEKYGLNVLKNYKVNRGEILDGLEYPIITKGIASNIGGGKADVFICHSENELKNAYKKIKSTTVLLQKYLYKKNELCMEGMSVNNGKELFISIASSYNYILEDRYSPYMTVRNFNNKYLQEKLALMIEEIGFEGIFEIEFLEDDDGHLYFGEINFRNSTWSYASTCAGMPLPVIWAESMQCNTLKKNYYKKIPDGFTAMVELNDFKMRVLTHKIGLIQWIREMKSCQCLYYMGKNDFKPVIANFLSRIISKKGVFKILSEK